MSIAIYYFFFLFLELYFDAISCLVQNNSNLDVLGSLCDARERHVGNSLLPCLDLGGFDMENGLQLLLFANHVTAGAEEKLLEGLDLLSDCAARPVLCEMAVSDLSLDSGGKGISKDYRVNKGHPVEGVFLFRGISTHGDWERGAKDGCYKDKKVGLRHYDWLLVVFLSFYLFLFLLIFNN